MQNATSSVIRTYELCLENTTNYEYCINDELYDKVILKYIMMSYKHQLGVKTKLV